MFKNIIDKYLIRTDNTLPTSPTCWTYFKSMVFLSTSIFDVAWMAILLNLYWVIGLELK